jgi:general secretion pathway protein H
MHPARPSASFASHLQGKLARRGAHVRGMTLIEILVVMAIMSLLIGGIVLGSQQTATARLRQSSALVAGAVKVAYARASATSKPTRIVFDMEKNSLWLEDAAGTMLVKRDDKSAAGGAGAASDEEAQAIKEGERIIQGPTAPRPSFQAVSDPGMGSAVKGPKELPRGIVFASVQTTHDDVARDKGRAYLYFWPGGQTERAAIVVKPAKSEDAITLQVSPLTGKVTTKDGAVPLAKPEDDKAASEREAPGAF